MKETMEEVQCQNKSLKEYANFVEEEAKEKEKKEKRKIQR